MKVHSKNDFPVSKVRRFLEPGPIVLVGSEHKGERDIMMLGWHMMLGLTPSLIGCYIGDQNHSYSLIRASKDAAFRWLRSGHTDQSLG